MWSRGKQEFISIESSILIPFSTPANPLKEYDSTIQVTAVTPAALSTSATDLGVLEILLIEESLPIVAVPLHIFQ